MLQNNKVKQPKQTLSERYNKDFLKQAEIRREKLQYRRMRVGQINNDRLEYMLKLLFQCHQNYYFGYFEASCALSGSMLEQALMILLEEKITEDGFVIVSKRDSLKNIERKQIKNVNK